MTLTAPITGTVRDKFKDHPMLIDSVTVVLGYHCATLTGPEQSVQTVARSIAQWVQDGLTNETKPKTRRPA